MIGHLTLLLAFLIEYFLLRYFHSKYYTIRYSSIEDATAAEELGIERRSRVEENRALAVERCAEATKDRDLGFLNLVKVFKEIERRSGVEENRALAVERCAEATKDRDLGFLNLVKVFKEIDGMDIDHIHRLIDADSFTDEEKNLVKKKLQNAIDKIKIYAQTLTDIHNKL